MPAIFAGIPGEIHHTGSSGIEEEYVTPGPPYWFGSANGHQVAFGLILVNDYRLVKQIWIFGPWIGIEEIAL